MRLHRRTSLHEIEHRSRSGRGTAADQHHEVPAGVRSGPSRATIGTDRRSLARPEVALRAKLTIAAIDKDKVGPRFARRPVGGGDGRRPIELDGGHCAGGAVGTNFPLGGEVGRSAVRGVVTAASALHASP